MNRYFKQYLMKTITEPHKVQIIDSLYEKLVQVPYSGLPKQALIKKIPYRTKIENHFIL